MIIVSNTSPIRYLIEVDAIDVLQKLFGEVFVPPIVLEELMLSHFPDKVREWAAHAPPPWIKVPSPSLPLLTSDTLHPGEAQAVALAVELKADRILLDDQLATPAVEQLAIERGLALRARGTLTVIAIAAQFGHLSPGTTLQRLVNETRFRATPELIDRFLRLDPDIRQIVEQEAMQLGQGESPHNPQP